MLRVRSLIVGLTVALLASGSAHAAFVGGTTYQSFALDSPFSGLGFSYFHLENFEDGLLNTPGVAANVGFVTSTGFAKGPIIDSVDEDDGSVDGTRASWSRTRRARMVS